MKYYLLLVVIPMVIISIIRAGNNKRRQQEASRAGATQPPPVMRDPAAEKPVREPAREAKPVAQPMAPLHSEGKHPEEIDAQKKKIHTEERTSALLDETRREIRDINLKRLRSAVVMSEILDRPVAMRKRSYPR